MISSARAGVRERRGGRAGRGARAAPQRARRQRRQSSSRCATPWFWACYSRCLPICTLLFHSGERVGHLLRRLRSTDVIHCNVISVFVIVVRLCDCVFCPVILFHQLVPKLSYRFDNPHFVWLCHFTSPKAGVLSLESSLTEVVSWCTSKCRSDYNCLEFVGPVLLTQSSWMTTFASRVIAMQ